MKSPASTINAVTLRDDIEAALDRRARYGMWPDSLRAAHAEHTRPAVFANLRFQLVMGLLVSVCALLFDALVLRDYFDLALGWRMLTTLPMTLIALLALRERHVPIIKLVAGISLICFGALEVHLASYAEPIIMARYTMGTVFLLGITCFVMPYTPRELARFALAYGLVTSLAGMWPNPLPPVELALHMSFTALVGVPCWAIARRHFETASRGYLLDMRDEFSRRDLEQSSELFRQLAEVDALTGLPNRRQFERVYAERMATPPPGLPRDLAVMMIDLDHFKAFNDRHGHQAGDRCLNLAGARLAEAFEGRDGIVARYGGEEFIAVLRERHSGEGAEVAEELRLAVAEMLLPVRDNPEPLITTSVGLAVAAHDPRLTLEDMVEMADTALYAAKRAGRNRVESVNTREDERLIA